MYQNYPLASKELFNNICTLKNLSCMALHAIIVFDKVYKWRPAKMYFKSIIKYFKRVKKTSEQISHTPPLTAALE